MATPGRKEAVKMSSSFFVTTQNVGLNHRGTMMIEKQQRFL